MLLDTTVFGADALCGGDAWRTLVLAAPMWGVRIAVTVQAVPLGPGPSLDIPKTRGSDDQSVIQPDDGEGHCTARLSPLQGSSNVSRGLDPALRHRTPPIERWIRRSGGHQPSHMTKLKRFETNVPALQHESFRCHHFTMLWIPPRGNRTCLPLEYLSSHPSQKKQHLSLKLSVALRYEEAPIAGHRAVGQ